MKSTVYDMLGFVQGNTDFAIVKHHFSSLFGRICFFLKDLKQIQVSMICLLCGDIYYINCPSFQPLSNPSSARKPIKLPCKFSSSPDDLLLNPTFQVTRNHHPNGSHFTPEKKGHFFKNLGVAFSQSLLFLFVPP